MPFTPDELAKAEKLLGRMEKDAKSWTWARWLLIANGVLLLGVSAWLYSTVDQLYNEQIEDLSRLVATTRPAVGVSPIDLVRVETVSMMYLFLLILTCGAIVSIGAGIGGWRKAQRDLLWVKIARSHLQQFKTPISGT